MTLLQILKECRPVAYVGTVVAALAVTPSLLMAGPAFADDAADLDRAHAICMSHKQLASPAHPAMWEPGWENCTAVMDRWIATESGKAAAAAKAAAEADKAFINGVAK